MLEPVENPVLLQTARQVREVRLVELHRIMLRGRRRDDALHHRRGQPVFAHQNLRHLNAGLVEPDAAVRALRQKPMFGPQHQCVGPKPARHARPLDQVRHQTVPGPPVAEPGVHRHIRQPADQLVRRNVRALGIDRDGQLEQPGNRLPHGQPLRQKHIGTKLRLNPYDPLGLDVGG